MVHFKLNQRQMQSKREQYINRFLQNHSQQMYICKSYQNWTLLVYPILQIRPSKSHPQVISMATVKKPRLVRQTASEQPPALIEMTCSCGQIFTQSLELTSHIFKKHIYSPEFEKMKSITQQLSVMKHLNKAGSSSENINSLRQNAAYTHLAQDSVQDIPFDLDQTGKDKKKQPKKPRKPRNADNSMNDLQGALGLPSQLSAQAHRQQDSKRQPQSKKSVQSKLLPQYKQIRSESEQESKQSLGMTKSQLHQKQPRRQQVRQFYNSRIFMCGECTSFFVYSAELNVHVSLYHNGQYPDGSIFGLKKHQILSFFKLPCEKPIFPQTHERQRKFKCGCGTLYSASSSLVNHIKLRHNSVAPTGTLGLPHTRRIKQFVFEGDVITFAT